VTVAQMLEWTHGQRFHVPASGIVNLGGNLKDSGDEERSVSVLWLSTSWFSRAETSGLPRNSSAGCCRARGRSLFASLLTGSGANRLPCESHSATSPIARTAGRTIALKFLINRHAKGNGKCADSNLPVRFNDYSPSTVSSRICSV